MGVNKPTQAATLAAEVVPPAQPKLPPLASRDSASALLNERVQPFHSAVNVQSDVAQANWSTKHWLWIKDKEQGYISGWIKSQNGDEVVIQVGDDRERTVNINDTEKMNPPKFDKVEDMADLTYLNEASVVHNLRLRYFSNLIYTYSGEFCVAVNPYRNLPLYTDAVVQSYKGKRRLDGPPHIYAVAENAYWEMTQGNRQNQSILITGESGAGKTENTKKVIQYLTAIASSRSQESSLENKILQANPILESFGNAQTVRNNNSSRFGKFIRIEFNASGIIAGANIERYLLEKSRVTHQSSKERSFHVFYQLLKGADADLKSKLLLDGSLNDYAYIKESKKDIEGVNDAEDFKAVLESMRIMGFTEEEKMDLFKVIAVILHLGNIKPVADRDDQAQLPDTSVAQRVCHLLGVPVDEFVKALIKPVVKAGREVVQQARSCDQVVYSLEALARAFYERMFGRLVDRINEALVKPVTKTQFIGVLDIAGFEIFDTNSFEQLCINYTNEKLQQFFNHHMFVKEQEEYERESIDWQFIDFGLDLQPTIELIENKQSPIGILSCLDEECVMPKATDRTFTEKLNTIWKGKSTKYETPRMAAESFTVQHYAGKVEYTTTGWLDKNKDPLNENITRLLAASTDKFFSTLFADYAGAEEESTNKRFTSVVKKGAFRTVAQRHKEQLQSLMAQLHSTKANFVRCILPNSEKRAGKLEMQLVLEQLRCNGVLEGIRISRAGFPSRLSFADFRKRYEVLAPGAIPSGFMDGRRASELILDKLALDKNQYRVGTSKVFFRAGVLADLEERRDHRLSAVFTRVQALWRGYKARRTYTRRVQQLRAIRVIQRNARVYVQLREWPWWRLYSKIKPLLNVTRIDFELQKKEEELQALQEARKRGEEEAKRLAALKQTLETEKKQIEDQLISERNAAADQAELLQRSQQRITELQEAIEELTGAFEKSTTQQEEYKRRCLVAEDERQRLKSQLSEINLAMTKMEKDRQQREQQILTLQTDLQVNVDQVTRLSNDKKQLEDEIGELRKSIESVTVHEADLSRQKTKLAAGFEELQEKLDAEQRAHHAVDQKRAQLETQLKETQGELIDVERARAEMEAVLKHKEADLTQLTDKLRTETTAKETLDRQRRELALKVDALEADLEQERSERQRVIEQKKKMESELDEVHNLMQEKGNSETKQSELRALREQELADTKASLAQITTEYDELRRKTSGEIDALKSNVADGNEEVQKLRQAKQALERQVKELSEQLHVANEDKVRHDKSSRQVAAELHDAKEHVEALNRQLADAAASHSTLDAQLQALTAKFDESELKASKFEREKAIIQKQNVQLQEDLEVETKKSTATEEVRKRLQANLTELSQRLDDEEAKKAELQKQLNAKTTEYDAIKSKYETEAVKKVHDAEEGRKKLELELNALREQFSLMESNIGNLEKTKQRLNGEIEDLKHEVEQEHANARQAEKAAKATEAANAQVQALLDQERRFKEVVESQARQLQATIDKLQQEMEAKTLAYSTLQRQKGDLETELKQLIDEFGEGGKNVHELEKQVRRLQTDLDDNRRQLEENVMSQAQHQESNRQLQQTLDELRTAHEQTLKAKDQQTDELRRALLKDINDMGTFLDEEKSAKAELLKHKKRLETELADIVSRQDTSAKNKTELEKARRLAEGAVKELQAKLDGEARARRELEDLARRQEQKANAATSQLEDLIAQVENLERDKRSLTKQVEGLRDEVDGPDEDSKVNLLAAKKTLERRVQELAAQLEEAEELKQAAVESAMNASPRGLADAEQLRKEIQQEYEVKMEQVEDSKRALLVAQKLAQQELDDKVKDLGNVEKQKRLMQAEIEDLRHRLESETLAKSEEASSRRKLASDCKELNERITLELARNADLLHTIDSYKAKHQDIMAKLEVSEVARLKADKEAANAKIAQRQAVEDAHDSHEAHHQAEERARGLERQVQLMQEAYEEARNELQEVNSVRQRQQQEVEIARDRALRDLADREQALDSLRKKYQQELEQAHSELDLERGSIVALRDAKRSLEQQLENMSSQLGNDQRQSITWKREKEKLETRFNDLNHVYLETQKRADEQQAEFASLQVKVRELQQAVDEQAAGKAAMDKMKRSLEAKLAEADDQLQQAGKARSAIEKAWSSLDKETSDLRQHLDEQQRLVEELTFKLQQANSDTQVAQAELNNVREQASEADRAKANAERQLKELTGRVVDLESTVQSETAKGAARLQSQVDSLSQQLVEEARVKVELQKNARELDRQLRNLQFQLSERDKSELRFKEEIDKMDQKLKKMKQQIDSLEANESNLILNRKRAERESEEWRDKSQRFEKEVERLRARMNGLESPVSN